MNRTLLTRIAAAVLAVAVAVVLLVLVLTPLNASIPNLPTGIAITPAPTPSTSASPTKEPAPATQLSIPNVCMRAANLIEDERNPKAAVDLIDKTRAPAIEALEGHEPLSAEMTDLLEACGPERRAAIAAIEAGVAPEPDPTPWSQQVQKWWESALKDWITPLTGPALVAGILAVLLVISARLFALAPGVRDRKTTVIEQQKLWRKGLALIVVGSIGIVIAITKLGDDLEIIGALAFAVGFAVLAGVGVHQLALFLATRLRLDLQVFLRSGDDKTEAEDKWATASVVALLSRMGGRTRRSGLEVVDAADIKALTDANLPDTPASKVIDVLKKAIAFVFTGTPWRIVVRTDPDGKLATVTITRNGASDRQVNIDTGKFSLPEKFDTGLAVRVFATAVVIMALSEKHDGFDGLYGTTRWQSFGLTYLALRELQKEPAEAERLLLAAATLDPGNHTARVGLESSLYKSADDAKAFADYARWLGEEAALLAEQTELPRAMEARVRATMLVMTLNARATDPTWSQGLGPSALMDNADKLAALLIAENIPDPGELAEWQQNAALSVASLPYTQRSRALAELTRLAHAQLRADQYDLAAVFNLVRYSAQLESAIAAQSVSSNKANLPNPWNDWYKDALETRAPYTAYNAACHLRVAGEPLSDVLAQLRIAVRDPQWKEYAPTDPEFQPISQAPGFRELTSSTPRTDFWDLSPFKPLKEELTAVGYAHPRKLVSLSPGTPFDELSVYLAIQAPQMHHVVDVSRLVAGIVEARPLAVGIDAVDVEIAAAMVDEGVNVPSDLESWVAPAPGAVSPFPALVEAINKKFNQSLDAAELGDWLLAVRTYVRRTAPRSPRASAPRTDPSRRPPRPAVPSSLGRRGAASAPGAPEHP